MFRLLIGGGRGGGRVDDKFWLTVGHRACVSRTGGLRCAVCGERLRCNIFDPGHSMSTVVTSAP